MNMKRTVRGVLCAMLIGAAWMSPGRAADPLAGLLACRDVADAGARLACFDRETATLSAPTSAAAPTARSSTSAPPLATPPPAAPAPAGTQASSPVAAPPLSPEQQFGLPERTIVAQEVAAGARAADPTKIEAHLVQVTLAADGRAVFSLDNRQVWRQLLAEGDLLAKPGDPVTISRGMLGSYWLELKSKRGCKVTRLM